VPAETLIDVSRLILIVTGSTLEAELYDRPTAYTLRMGLFAWLQSHLGGAVREGDLSTAWGPRIVLCSDIWYLNQEELRTCPTISIGGPGSNALTAFLGDKLPSAFVVEGATMVQMDVQLKNAPGEVVCACWGTDPVQTAAAVGVFRERYIDIYMEAATEGW
jgi:hypothetical protein